MNDSIVYISSAFESWSLSEIFFFLRYQPLSSQLPNFGVNNIIVYVVELKMTYWPLLHFFHVLWVFLLSCLIHLCLLQGIKTVMKTPKSETPISKMESRDIGKDTIGSKTLTVENSSYFVERKLHIWDSNHRASQF